MKYFILISLAYFLTRLLNLTLIPIFTDEAIYLRWSQVMANNLNFLFLPLTDGKAPLFIWAAGFVMHLFPNSDPLISGRIVSVVSGYFSLLGIYLAGSQLFHNKKIGLLSSLLYLLSPFTFFYDRFALVDGMLAMFGIWSLAFAVCFVQTVKLKYALALGLTIGLGLLTKTQAIFFFILFPLAWFFLKFEFKRSYLIGGLLSTVVGILIYNALRVFSEFYIIGLKTAEFVTFPSLSNFSNNFVSLVKWQVSYLTIPIVLLIIFALLKKSRERLFLLAPYALYFVAVCLINKVIYARFLLLFTPFLLILAAAGINDIKSKYFKVATTVLVLTLPLVSIFYLLTRPEIAPIADNDSNQYINSWASGRGVKETAAFFETLPKKKTVVGVEGTFGLLPFALEMYNHKYPNIEIKPYWPPPSTLPDGLDYYIIYQRPTPKNMPLELIAKYRQGTSNDFFKLFKVK